jgi:hypothetical protein
VRVFVCLWRTRPVAGSGASEGDVRVHDRHHLHPSPADIEEPAAPINGRPA